MRVMLVGDAGEFRVIEALARTIAGDNDRNIDRLSKRGFRLRLSIGDDAAAWDAPAGVRVFTTDTMVEGVHFSLDTIGWRDLGWKAMAVNHSDIAAMGCTPLYAIVTLGLRGDIPVEGLAEMYRGMMDLCGKFGGAVVGGDIVRSPAFFVTVALQGTADEGATLLTRDAARAGDQIAVTGHLGCSGGGLRVLTEGLSVDEEAATHLKDAHNRPQPRVGQGAVLVQKGVRAAMDVSDGLVNDLEKMCEASGVGARVRLEDVPADDALKAAFPDDWPDLALGGGEDYELLFTAPADVIERIGNLDVPVSIIGDIVDGPPLVQVLDSAGNRMELGHGGWDHFERT